MHACILISWSCPNEASTWVGAPERAFVVEKAVDDVGAGVPCWQGGVSKQELYKKQKVGVPFCCRDMPWWFSLRWLPAHKSCKISELTCRKLGHQIYGNQCWQVIHESHEGCNIFAIIVYIVFDSLPWLTSNSQESKSAVHRHSHALGTKSGKNDARDFWTFTDIGVAPWPSSSRVRGVARQSSANHSYQGSMHSYWVSFLIGRL